MASVVYDFGDIVSLSRVRSAKLCVLGCGAVGCNAVLAALQMGYRNFTLVDYDAVSAHNCPRSAGLFHPARDVGKSKARLLAGYIRAWEPACEATWLEADVRDLGGAFFRDFTAVVVALDNMESVWHVGEMTADSGVSVYRGATNGWNSSAEILNNSPGGACLCCKKDPAQSRDTRIASCGARYGRDVRENRASALQTSSALCANRLVAEMTRRLETPGPDRRYYETEFGEMYAFDLGFDPKCACHGEAHQAIMLEGDIEATTMDQLIERLERALGEGVTVFGADDYVLEGACKSCGASYPVGKPLRRVKESDMRHCPISERAADDAWAKYSPRGQEASCIPSGCHATMRP